MAAWCDFWCTQILPGTVTAQTVINYRQRLDCGLLPYVGRIPLARLAPDDVQIGMRALEAKGLAASTWADARATLVQALNQAVRWGKVSRNAAALVKAPSRAGYRLDDALDAEEAQRVLGAATGDRLEALAILVLTVGLRQGEALALRWDDIDLKAGTVSVTRSKTPAGVRTVALPELAVVALRSHRAAQRRERLAAPVWADSRLVFTSEAGTPVGRRDCLRWWHRRHPRGRGGPAPLPRLEAYRGDADAQQRRAARGRLGDARPCRAGDHRRRLCEGPPRTAARRGDGHGSGVGG